MSSKGFSGMDGEQFIGENMKKALSLKTPL